MVDICVHPYTAPHVNFAVDNSISGTPEAISAYMYQFQVISMKLNGFKPNGNFGQEASSPTTNFENINM